MVRSFCRMCETYDVMIPCLECGACIACASDDCGFCIDRIEFFKNERERAYQEGLLTEEEY